jgi:hypothetical protein
LSAEKGFKPVLSGSGSEAGVEAASVTAEVPALIRFRRLQTGTENG